MPLTEYKTYYEYDYEDESKVWAQLGLLQLMAKLNIVVVSAELNQCHVGDITLTVLKRYYKSHPPIVSSD